MLPKNPIASTLKETVAHSGENKFVTKGRGSSFMGGVAVPSKKITAHREKTEAQYLITYSILYFIN